MVQFFVVQSPNLSDLDLPQSSSNALGPNSSPLSLLLGQAQPQRLPDTTRQFPFQFDSDSGSDSNEKQDKGSVGHGLLAFPRRAVSPQALPGYPLTKSNVLRVDQSGPYTAPEIQNFLALGFLNDFMLAFEKFMGGKLVKGKHTATVMQDEPLREEWEGLRLLIDGPGIILDNETSHIQPNPAVVEGSENQPAVHSYPVSPPLGKKDEMLRFRAVGVEWSAKYIEAKQEWLILDECGLHTRQFIIRLGDSRRLSYEQEYDVHYLLHSFIMRFAQECGGSIIGNWYDDWTYQWIDDDNPHIVIFGPGILKDGEATMDPHENFLFVRGMTKPFLFEDQFKNKCIVWRWFMYNDYEGFHPIKEYESAKWAGWCVSHNKLPIPSRLLCHDFTVDGDLCIRLEMEKEEKPLVRLINDLGEVEVKLTDRD
ncbi:hypothetical protein T439DRAFT_352596 [Meredithblackwellia eburnea MCA 4105]